MSDVVNNKDFQKFITDSNGETLKYCKKCNTYKKLTEFNKNRPECRPCDNAKSRAYKANNKKKISDYNKEYKAEHKEEISAYNYFYNQDNRDEIQKRQTKQHNERRLIDPNFRISGEMRTILTGVIKSKTTSIDTLSKFGCSKDFLDRWFEFLFEFNEGMSMNNYGDYWHIDHVIPCSKFNVSDPIELKRCFHWTNLQPLKALENSKKVANTNLEEIQFQEERVTIFLDTIYSGDTSQYTLLEEYDKTKYLN